MYLALPFILIPAHTLWELQPSSIGKKAPRFLSEYQIC